MIISLDTETNGVLWHHEAFCATTYSIEDGGRFWVLPDEWWPLQCYLREATRIVCHNLKFDIQKLILAGVLDEVDLDYEDKFEDTMIYSHLIDENRSRRLKDLAKELLGVDTDEDEALRKVRRELGLTKEDGYDKIPLEILKPYALKDAEYTFLIWWDHLMGSMRDDPQLYALYRREITFCFKLLKIEAAGLGVDVEYLKTLKKNYGSLILKDKKLIEEITCRPVFNEYHLEPLMLAQPVWNKAGTKILREWETKAEAKERALRTTFNPNSVPQVIEEFARHGVKLKATDKTSLLNLTHPLAAAILGLRERMKIRQTYILGILEEQRNGILHPNFRQTGTKTGRLSSASGE